MSPEQITQGEELLEKATRGPWKVRAMMDNCPTCIESSIDGEPIVYSGIEDDGGVCMPEDAELIVYLRNNAPALLEAAKEVERLKKRIACLENPLPTQEEEKAFYHRAYHVCHTGCPLPCPSRI